MDKFNIPTVIIVYGVTGDLMARKITPALFNLYTKGKLPKMFQVIGVSRRDLSDDEFRRHVIKITKAHAETNGQDEKIEKFCSLFFYHKGDFKDEKSYTDLSRKMGRIDDGWNVCSNKLFYLAVPPSYYETIFTNLHDSHLTDPCSPEEGWTRVLVEKPFGQDLNTAKKLDTLLSNLFKEEQIYRIDHYLGKEMMQNILAFRFSNNFLEQSWSNEFISRIDIRLLEDNDASKRGAFYESMGALRDVGQNHLLQMLALVTMNNPGMLTADAIRKKRAEILQTLIPPSEQMIKKSTIRAQYDEYRSHEGVSDDSQVETYFKTRASLSSNRWDGVPIYLSSGKGFSKSQKEIVVTFQNPQQCLNCEPGKDYNNQVVFSLEPEERISINFFSKKPGLDLEIQKKELGFVYRSTKERKQYVEEYEKLLLDCIRGDQTLFVSTDELLPMWEYTDAVVKAWEKNIVELQSYKKGSDEIAYQETEGEKPDTTIQPMPRDVGLVGLGKMGGGMALQLTDHGWRVHAYNRTREVTKKYERKGIYGVYSYEEYKKKLKHPRVVILSLSAGKAIDEVLFGRARYASQAGPLAEQSETAKARLAWRAGLIGVLEKGDIIIDAGNSHYKDTIRRYGKLKKEGIRYVDVGVSGGPSGARFGACLMIGGDRDMFEYLKPLFSDISVPRGYQFFEGAGAGHFVKMVHNGIEYGMMQAIAEGFSVLKESPFKLDLTRVSDVYNRGSVIQSRLIGWLKEAYTRYGVDLDKISGSVSHSGEGEWTVDAADEIGIETKIIKGSLQFRLDSDKTPSYTGKVVSALRGQFGGHDVEE